MRHRAISILCLTLGCGVMGGILWLVGRSGARLGWYLKQRNADQPVVPDAQALG